VTHDENGHHPVYGYGEVSAARLRDLLVADAPEPGRACACSAAGSTPWSALLALAAFAGLRRSRYRASPPQENAHGPQG
jgi:MYXO-CTERM domain-containing protein